MILFINGCFGVGKSTIASLLHQTIPNSMVYDPEEVGFMVRNILEPVDKQSDFQDYSAWRKLVPKVAELLKQEYDKTLIVPMCVWKLDYFQDVTGELKTIDKDFYHFCLTASEEVIMNRLKSHENYQWAMSQVSDAAAAFQNEIFEIKIDTTESTPEEIVKVLMSHLP